MAICDAAADLGQSGDRQILRASARRFCLGPRRGWDRYQTFLKASEDTVFRAGRDTEQVHHVDDDQEQAKDTANHHQAPWHLMRALIFLAHGADFGMRKHAKTNQGNAEAKADDPVDKDCSDSVSRG